MSIVSTGPLDIKIKHLTDHNLSFVKKFMKAHDFWNVCKKSVNKGYIKAYFDLNLKNSKDEYLIQLYDGKKVIGFVILFIKYSKSMGKFAEVMIICAKSKMSRIGSGLLRYTEVFAKEEINASHVILCSLNTPFGFYKKMGYNIMDGNYCRESGKKYQNIYNYFDDENDFKKQFDLGIDVLQRGECPYNAYDSCVYMYKKL